MVEKLRHTPPTSPQTSRFSAIYDIFVIVFLCFVNSAETLFSVCQNIFTFLFRTHNIISLSSHKQVYMFNEAMFWKILLPMLVKLTQWWEKYLRKCGLIKDAVLVHGIINSSPFLPKLFCSMLHTFQSSSEIHVSFDENTRWRNNNTNYRQIDRERGIWLLISLKISTMSGLELKIGLTSAVRVLIASLFNNWLSVLSNPSKILRADQIWHFNTSLICGFLYGTY